MAIFDKMRVTAPSYSKAASGLGKLQQVDVQIKVSSLVAPYLRQPIVQVDQVDKTVLLLAHLKESVPRSFGAVDHEDNMRMGVEERQAGQGYWAAAGQLFGRRIEAAKLSSTPLYYGSYIWNMNSDINIYFKKLL